MDQFQWYKSIKNSGSWHMTWPLFPSRTFIFLDFINPDLLKKHPIKKLLHTKKTCQATCLKLPNSLLRQTSLVSESAGLFDLLVKRNPCNFRPRTPWPRIKTGEICDIQSGSQSSQSYIQSTYRPWLYSKSFLRKLFKPSAIYSRLRRFKVFGLQNSHQPARPLLIPKASGGAISPFHRWTIMAAFKITRKKV